MLLKKVLIWGNFSLTLTCCYLHIYILFYLLLRTNANQNGIMLQLYKERLSLTQPAISCSKLTIETLEQGVKYV